MKNIYFMADSHFNHANIIYFCQRPFASVAEMNEALIAKWNARVGKGDTVPFPFSIAFSFNIYITTVLLVS